MPATSSSFRKELVLGIVLILCLGQVNLVHAAPQGPIQDAIDAAPAGGTVDISAGIYSETLVVDKNLTLRGESSATTILQPADTGQRVITVTDGHNLRLEILTVTGGDPVSNVGGGVFLAGGGLELVSCVVSSNTADYGGGVFQGGAGGYLIVTGSQILGNTAAETGGGLFAAGSATLTNTTLSGNTAGRHGGGMHADRGAVLTGGTINSNHAASGNGGGVNLNDGLTIDGTHFEDNSAGDSGGGVTQWNTGQTVSISDAEFSGNSARNNGGGAFIRLSRLTISDTSFSANTVNSGGSGNVYGGGLYAGGGLDGSALTFTSNSVVCTSCNFSSGGGLFIKRPASGTSPSSIDQSTFESNQAWFGSGIDSETDVLLTLIRSTFRNNGHPLDSGYGGGVAAAWVNGDQLLFQGNTVLNAGGGMNVTQATLTRSSFIANSVMGGGGGGGVHAYRNFTGTNLVFVGNTASNGAAMRIVNGPAVLWHATISRPAQAVGPAICNDTGTMELKNSILTNYNPGIYLAGQLTEDYNMYYSNTNNILQAPGGVVTSGGHSTGAVSPQFANPAGGDYHLLPTSPAINMGANLGVTIDRDELPRLNRWDAGAYQFYWKQHVPLIRK